MQLWNAMTGAHIATLTGHSDEIMDVCFDYAGQRIATASADGKWSDWNYYENIFVLSFVLLDQSRVLWVGTIGQILFVALWKVLLKLWNFSPMKIFTV